MFLLLFVGFSVKVLQMLVFFVGLCPKKIPRPTFQYTRTPMFSILLSFVKVLIANLQTSAVVYKYTYVKVVFPRVFALTKQLC